MTLSNRLFSRVTDSEAFPNTPDPQYKVVVVQSQRYCIHQLGKLKKEDCIYFNFSADITPKMLKLCRVTKVKVFFLKLAYVFNFR